MTRSVTDAAIMLNALRSPFGAVRNRKLPRDYTRFLKRGRLKGARIGVDRLNFQEDYFAIPELNAVTEHALEVMADLGATIVDIDPADCPDPNAWFDPEFTVLLNEFKHDIRVYLASVRHTSMRTLEDLIQFNLDHCPEEMQYFGQELFELAETFSGDLDDPDYLEARAVCIDLAGTNGLDKVLDDNDLDVLVSPAYSVGYSAAAVAGYASISVPAGVAEDGRPGCVWMSGRFLAEPKLIALAYDLEQELGPRAQPMYLGEVPGPFPDAGLCAVPETTDRGIRSPAERRRLVREASPMARRSRPGR